MEFIATVHHGPLSIEIKGENREEIQQEVLDLASFVEENEDKLNSFRQVRGQVDIPNSGGIPPQVTAGEDNKQPGEAGDLSSIAERTQVEEAILERIFEVPDDENEVPFLKLFQHDGGVNLLGSARNQQQANGSVILLYLWQQCRDVEQINLEKLDDALEYSEITTERRGAMYDAYSGKARNWLDSDGSAIKLTPRGKQEAKELIKRLAEEVST